MTTDAGAGAGTKIDLKHDYPELYSPVRRAKIVEVPPLMYLKIDGKGDPNTAPAYAEAVAALYAVAFGAKFAVRKATGVDFGVMPLEGLWWSSDMKAFMTGEKSAWSWTMMIMQPASVTAEVFAAARDAAAKAEKAPAATLGRLRLEVHTEGRAAQLLHLGPYANEGPTVKALHAFIDDQRLVPSGRHHEIYLGDPRRTAPERLKTILRQPVAPRPPRGR